MGDSVKTLGLRLEQDTAALLAEVANFNATGTKASARRVRTMSVALGKLAKAFRAESVKL